MSYLKSQVVFQLTISYTYICANSFSNYIATNSVTYGSVLMIKFCLYGTIVIIIDVNLRINTDMFDMQLFLFLFNIF